MATLGNIAAHFRFFKPKPKIIPQIAQGFYRRLILGQPVLRTVDWAVTYNCNALCQMCSARKLYNPKRKDLTLKQRQMVWEQAKKLGVIHTQFTGGEPLTKGIDWLCQAIRDLEPDKVIVAISTNAALLDNQKLQRLKKAGLDTISMSIDSLNPEVHNQLRGLPGNFDHILKLLSFAKKIGLNICLGSVISPNHLDEAYQLAQFTQKEGVMLAVNLVSSPDCWQTNYFTSWSKKTLLAYNQLLKLPNVRNDTFFNFYGRSGCPSGERIYISAYGDVFLCPHVQVSFGNVLEEPLKNIWLRIWKTPPLTKFSQTCRWAFNRQFYQKFVQPFEKLPQRPVGIETVMRKGYLDKVDRQKIQLRRTFFKPDSKSKI